MICFIWTTKLIKQYFIYTQNIWKWDFGRGQIMTVQTDIFNLSNADVERMSNWFQWIPERTVFCSRVRLIMHLKGQSDSWWNVVIFFLAKNWLRWLIPLSFYTEHVQLQPEDTEVSFTEKKNGNRGNSLLGRTDPWGHQRGWGQFTVTNGNIQSSHKDLNGPANNNTTYAPVTFRVLN